MSDERTQAQKDADEAIRAALIQHMEAYSDDVPELAGNPAVLKDWVFAYAGKAWVDGDPVTRYGTFCGPDTASYEAMGLTRHLDIYFEAQLYEED